MQVQLTCSAADLRSANWPTGRELKLLSPAGRHSPQLNSSGSSTGRSSAHTLYHVRSTACTICMCLLHVESTAAAASHHSRAEAPGQWRRNLQGSAAASVGPALGWVLWLPACSAPGPACLHPASAPAAGTTRLSEAQLKAAELLIGSFTAACSTEHRHMHKVAG